MLFLILLILWLIFNGRCTLDVLCVGAVVSLAVCWFARKYCKWSAADQWRWVKLLPGVAAYCGLLVWEIIKANLAVIRIILAPDMKSSVQPELVRFPVNFKSPMMRALLANSITLTPGTITVRMLPDHFIVHALNPGMGEGMETSSFYKGCQRLDEYFCSVENEKEASHV